MIALRTPLAALPSLIVFVIGCGGAPVQDASPTSSGVDSPPREESTSEKGPEEAPPPAEERNPLDRVAHTLSPTRPDAIIAEHR